MIGGYHLRCVIFFTLLAYLHLSGFAQDTFSDSLAIVGEFNQVMKGQISIDIAKDNLHAAIDFDSAPKALDTYYYFAARTSFLLGQLESAQKLAEQGVDFAPTYLDKAKHFNIQASVYSYKRDYSRAIQTFKQTKSIYDSLRIYDKSALVDNNIANIFFSLMDYESAYKYAHAAYDTLKVRKDTLYLPSVIGVASISAIKLKKLIEADKLAHLSLRLSKQYQNPLGLILSNYALGELKLEKGHYEESENHYLASLSYAKKYNQTPYITINKIGLQYLYVMIKDYQKALMFGLEALEESLKLNNQNTLYAINKNLALSYKGSGNHSSAFDYMQKAHELYEEFSSEENRTHINEILLKYENEKKERLLTEQELTISDNEAELYRQYVFLVLLFLLILILAFYTFFLINKRKIEKQKAILDLKNKEFQAKIAGEFQERKRIASELHDSIAGALTAVRIQLTVVAEEKGQLTKIKASLDQIHADTRRISHNLYPNRLAQLGLIQSLKGLCADFSTKDCKVKFDSVLDSLILIEHVEQIVYQSIQELLQNAVKHANATEILVSFAINNDDISIICQDNGKGSEAIIFGHGLLGLQQKVEEIQGELKLNSRREKGTKVEITLKKDVLGIAS